MVLWSAYVGGTASYSRRRPLAQALPAGGMRQQNVLDAYLKGPRVQSCSLMTVRASILKRDGWIEQVPGVATRLEVEVREPSVRHTVTPS